MHYHIVYLHGFLSSPHSAKVAATRAYFEGGGLASVSAPDLNVEPDAVLERIGRSLAGVRAPGVLIGSSLGGFFAAHMAARLSLPCILINPCLSPWRFASRYLGEQPIYGGVGTFVVRQRYVERLHAMGEAPAFSSGRSTLVLLGTADEVLDWREAQSHFSACEQIVVEGDDHRLSTYSHHLPQMARFIERALGEHER